MIYEIRGLRSKNQAKNAKKQRRQVAVHALIIKKPAARDAMIDPGAALSGVDAAPQPLLKTITGSDLGCG